MFLKKIKKLTKKIKNKYILILLVLLLVSIISNAFLQFYSIGKISPGIKIVGFDVSNKTKDQALQILQKNIKPKENLYLIEKNKRHLISLKDINFSYDLEKTIQKAYYDTRTGNFFYDLCRKINILFQKENLGLEIIIDEKILKEKIQELGKNIEIKPVEPSVSLLNSTINVQEGTKGKIIDYLKLRANIGKNLAFLEEYDLEIPLMQEGTTLNKIEIQIAKERASKIIGKNIVLKYNESNFNINDQILISFINPKSEYFDKKILAKISEISLQIDREPQNSVFVFEESRVKEFKPSLDGYEVKKDILKNMVIGNLRTLEQSEFQSQKSKTRM